MWTLLLKLKLQHILIILIALLLGFSVWVWDMKEFHKYESLRKGDNYENLRDLDSLKTAILTLTTNTEIEGYLNTNKGLKNLLSEQDIKIKRLQSIVYQKQRYIDNIERETDVSEMVSNIRNNVSAVSKWRDSTECLLVEGNVTYSQDSLSVGVTNREFNNEIAVTSSWLRDQRNLWTRWFGRKEPHITVSTKCGESKTIIINRK